VKQALAAGSDPNALDEEGHTVLFWASFKGDRAIVKLLIAAGSRGTGTGRCSML
jgi:ankyrin repeat protein